MEYLQIIGGIMLLLYSGKYLVDGGVSLAEHLKIPTLIIGVTVIAFGTSAPELIVSANAAFNGHPEIAIGNVVGSNIGNIGLILGLTALIVPIPVNRVYLKIDWPVMMLAGIVLLLMMLDGSVSRGESALLFLMLVAYTIFIVWYSKKTGVPTDLTKGIEEVAQPKFSLAISMVVVVLAIAGLVFGAKFLVIGASSVASSLGISERVISLTIVAIGTSMPELTASIMAAMKKQADIAVGNVIGSNIFNIFGVIGVSGLITPISIEQGVFGFDTVTMLAISILLLLFIFPFQTVYIKRWEGMALLAFYGVYMWMLFSGNTISLPF